MLIKIKAERLLNDLILPTEFKQQTLNSYKSMKHQIYYLENSNKELHLQQKSLNPDDFFGCLIKKVFFIEESLE